MRVWWSLATVLAFLAAGCAPPAADTGAPPTGPTVPASIITTSSSPSSSATTSTPPTTTQTAGSSTTEASFPTTSSGISNTSVTASTPPALGMGETFLGVLPIRFGGLWVVPLGNGSDGLDAPLRSFPHVRSAVPDGSGGLVVATVADTIYHLPAGRLPAVEIPVSGNWSGAMGSVDGEAAVIVESFSWIDAEFVYDCEEEPCTGDQGYMMGTGEQVFTAVPVSGRDSVELVRHLGRWGLSGAPEDVVSAVSVGGDRLLVNRHTYGLTDCGQSGQPACEQSWLEFLDMAGQVVEVTHNPAPTGSPAGEPLSWYATGELSTDGRLLLYETPGPPWAVVARDLETGAELARIARGSPHNGEATITAWSFDRDRTLLTVWQTEPWEVASAKAELVRLTSTGPEVDTLDLPAAFVDHLITYDVSCCDRATYAPRLDIDIAALDELSHLPADLATKLALRADGIGSLRFGDREDDVLNQLTAVLGSPTIDTRYAGPWPDETGCAGATGYGCDEYLRLARWALPDLLIVFSDGSDTATPTPTSFTGWSYDGGMALVTPEGITVGTSLDDLQALVGADRTRTRRDPETGTWGSSLNGIGIRLTSENTEPTYVWQLHAGNAHPSL